MAIPRNAMLRLEADPTSRRRHGRVRCEETRCTLGTILDLSASGMRVLIKGRPRCSAGEISPLLIDINGSALALKARVVWLNKAAWRRYIAGVEFVDLTPDLRARLAELARVASNNEYIREGIDPAARSA